MIGKYSELDLQRLMEKIKNSKVPDYMKFNPEAQLNEIRIQRLGNYGKPQEQFIISAWEEFVASAERNLMILGEKYFRNDNDIIHRKRTTINAQGELEPDDKLSNARLSHPFLNKLVKQKVNYLLSRPFTIKSKSNNKLFEEEINKYFTKEVRNLIKQRGIESINKGKSWVQVYYDENNKLCFKSIPSEEVRAFWNDNEHRKKDAIIRKYNIDKYDVDGSSEEIEIFEYHTIEGEWKYQKGTKGLQPYEEYDEDGKIIENPRQYFTSETKDKEGNITKNELGWGKIPFVCFKYNAEELPLIKFVKLMIDDYDTNTSDFSNFLQDVPKNVNVVKNYSGQDISEFVHNMRMYRTVLVDGDGDLTNLTTQDNSSAYDIHLNRLRKDIYDSANCVDTQSTDLGNASGQALKFRFADLDNDVADMANEFETAINELLWFIKADILQKTNVNYGDEEIEVIFNTDIIINESETIENLKNSVGIISNETIIRNHPYVTDADKELELVKKEKEEEQKQFMMQGDNGFGKPNPDDED